MRFCLLLPFALTTAVATAQTRTEPLKLEWQQSVPANVRRIAVADTVGDGKLRLVLLTEGDRVGTRAVAVCRWDGKLWVTEFAANAPERTDRLAVGKFAAGRPAVIVTNTSLWTWNGSAYEEKLASRIISLFGSVILKDGAERVLANERTGLKLLRVDPTKDDWLVNPEDPPGSADARFTEMKAFPAELTAGGLPAILTTGGIVGLWDTRKPDGFYLYAVESLGKLQNKQGDPVVKGRDHFLMLLNPKTTELKAVWTSPKLDGDVLDIALSDPHGSKSEGLVVLTDGLQSGKGHTLYFFKLQ